MDVKTSCGKYDPIDKKKFEENPKRISIKLHCQIYVVTTENNCSWYKWYSTEQFKESCLKLGTFIT